MECTGYLFVHFTGEQKDGEQIYFSLSRDGLYWDDLNEGKPVLFSYIGEGGVRDPFIVRSPWPVEGKNKYYLIATDLRIEAGKGWDVAQYSGSRDIMVWESENLVDWNGPVAHPVGVSGAGCVWAPEAIYDREKDMIMIFWASMVKESGEAAGKQRIYAAYTRDFKHFTEPFPYLERDNHVIDTTIIHTQEGYYRYSKDETTKNIRADFSKSLEADSFRDISSKVLDELYGVEGPEIFKFNDREEWCLIVDRFATGEGYLPLLTDNLAGGEFRMPGDKEFDMGKTKKRHGGILNLTEAEYQLLKNEEW